MYQREVYCKGTLSELWRKKHKNIMTTIKQLQEMPIGQRLNPGLKEAEKE